MNYNGSRHPIIESLIIASPEPLPVRKITEVLDEITPREIDEIVDELNIKYTNNDISFRIRKIGGGYQVYIIENYARYVEDLFTRRRNVRLTRAALETLAITAYRQPVTKTDIEMIRGVASDSVIHTLLERKLITLAGRAETIGRPLLYKTTNEFLKFFNLNALEDLPKMEEIEELLAANDPPPPQTSLPLNTDDNLEPSGDESIDSKTADERTDDSPELPEHEIPMGPFAAQISAKPDAESLFSGFSQMADKSEAADEESDDTMDEETVDIESENLQEAEVLEDN